jgi:hypothetical protein
MFKSKSILLLKSFDQNELKRFSEFLSSPYFNKNARVTKLFGELKKYYPEFTSKGAAKENLYKKLFPGKTYNEQVMKNLISELLKLEKEFLSVDWYTNDPNEKSLGLITKLLKRPVEPIFDKEVETLISSLGNSELSLNRVNLFMHELEEKRFNHDILNNRQSSASEHIEKSGEYLTIFFLRSILHLSINNHVNRFSFNLDIEKNFADRLINSIEIQKLLDYIESVNPKEALSLKLTYYALVSIVNVDDDTAYKRYHDMLHKNLNNLGRDDVQIFLQFTESICAQKINGGKTSFYNDLFETYEQEIQRNVYNPDPSLITVLKFRNICLTAIRVGKYNWAEKFINDFKNRLQKPDRKNTVELAQAQLNFARGNFSESLEHLNRIKTTQMYFKVDVKNLNLMALYELEHYESAISLIESFKKMLTTNPALTKQYSQKNVNFINSVNTLIRLKTENKPGEAAVLQEKIESYDILSNKKWLNEKVSELSGIKK